MGRLGELSFGGGKSVGAGGQTQFLGCQTADTFAVHGQLGRPRRGDHGGQSFNLNPHQFIGSDGLDFRHDQMGTL